MSKIIFCCFFVILLEINNCFALPASVIKSPAIPRVDGTFDLSLYSHNHELIKNILHEYLGYARNYLSSVRNIAKAAAKVLEEEFNVHKWLSSHSLADIALKNAYDSCIYVQQFVNTTESILPPIPIGYPKQHSETYIYKRAYYGLKNAFSTMRGVAAEIVKSFHYFDPEVSFTRCMAKYVTHTHPKWISKSLAAFPIIFVEYAYRMLNDFVKTFQNTNLELEHKNSNVENNFGNTASVQNFVDPQVVWAFEQLLSDSNEISQYRELNSKLSDFGKYFLQLFNLEKIATQLFGGAVETPMKCIQQYALQFLWNRADILLSR